MARPFEMRSMNRAARRALFRRVAAFGLLALLAAGCQGKGDVSGKVTYKDKPLVFGTVTFEGSDRNLHYANIERDGSYSVTGVATGEAKVAVSSTNPKSSDFTPLQREGGPAPPPRPDYPGWFAIPPKYDTTFTSGLTYPIKRGSNEINIELK
jgi:hypothetical protein